MKNINTNSKKKQKMNRIVFSSSVILICFAVASFAYDIIYINHYSLCPILSFPLVFRPITKGNIVAAFNTLWSVAVTVTIFILEISTKYKYGVSLRRIVIFALGRIWTCVGVGSFIMLFPLFYICMKFNFMQTGLWCLCTAFIIFTAAIAFFAWMYIGKNIRKVITEKTLEQLLSLGENKSSDNTQRKLLHGTIDGLAITDMLDHINYENMDDVGGLIDMCRDLLAASEGWDALYKSKLDNLIIATWVDHIIHNCKWDTEFDCCQNINTLLTLWQVIIKAIPWKLEQKRHTSLSICIQFLLPFINACNEEKGKILIRLWKEFGVQGKNAFIYLLLYSTYRTNRWDSTEYKWMLQDDPLIRRSLKEILNGCFFWDRNFAMRCWIDWSKYDSYENINLTSFIQFSSDIDKLYDGRLYEIKTPTLIHAIGGIK